MRKIFSLFVIAVSIVSCVQVVTAPVYKTKEITVMASMGDGYGTKTVLNDGKKVFWCANDSIKLFCGSQTSGIFRSTNIEPVETATFKGSLDVVTGSVETGSEETILWALHPYQDDAACDAKSITLTVPAVQHGMLSSFGPDCFPSIGKSQTYAFRFYNVCGGMRFSVCGGGIRYIKIKSNAGEPLAGKVIVVFGDDGKPVVDSVIDGQSEVTLYAPDVSGFEVGAQYYVALLPGTLSEGISVSFSDAFRGIYRQMSPVTVHRSVFGIVNDVDMKAVPEAHDLSAAGTANSYVVSHAGSYKIKVARGNTSEPVGNVESAALLWESFGTGTAPAVGDLVDNVIYDDGYLHFTTTGKAGNAVVAVKDAQGNVLWSWHIWCSDASLDEMVVHTWNNAGDVLDRNLGALSNTRTKADAFTLLYRYGDKNPMLSGYHDGLNNVFAASVANGEMPDGGGGNYGFTTDNGWTNSKGVMDPCPPGYKIPERYFYATLYEAYSMGESPYRDIQNYGSICVKNDSPVLWFPYVHRFTRYGEYHYSLLGSTRYDDGVLWTVGSSFYHSVYDGMIFPDYANIEQISDAPVRCVKESNAPIVNPTGMSISRDSLRVDPGESVSLSASILPADANVQDVYWTQTSGLRQSAYLGNECTYTTQSIGKYVVAAYSPFAVRWSDDASVNYSSALVGQCTIYCCPSEPSGEYGGWYLKAKAGDTISFRLLVGDSDPGDNYYEIYKGDTMVARDIYQSAFSVDNYSYTFTEDFQGWFYIEVGWGLDVSDIETSATVLGRGNNFTSEDRLMYDRWKKTPNFKFKYQNHALEM